MVFPNVREWRIGDAVRADSVSSRIQQAQVHQSLRLKGPGKCIVLPRALP
jgi:hypothetical protein